MNFFTKFSLLLKICGSEDMEYGIVGTYVLIRDKHGN